MDPCTDSDLWIRTCRAFPILKNEKENDECGADELDETIRLLKEQEYEVFVEEMVLCQIEEDVRLMIVPQFWAMFTPQTANDTEGFKTFKEAVAYLHAAMVYYLPILERLEQRLRTCPRVVYGEKKLVDAFKLTLRACLHSRLPIYSQVIVEDFYRVSFKVFSNADKSEVDCNDSTEDIVQCGGCGIEVESCNCQDIINLFHETNSKLIELELLERLAGEVLTSLLHRRIETHVQETCKGSFDKSYIATLEKWLQCVVMSWLMRIYGHTTDPGEITTEAPRLAKFAQKLRHLLYETYTRTRIDQLFNIIIEYPDSEPAIEDLRLCLEKTDLRCQLICKLQRALETRLLHPGVNTPDILTAYIAAIRALTQLDPTGVLLETVTHPVRQYLRWRTDTVRCVVSSLTEDGPSDLAEELLRGGEGATPGSAKGEGEDSPADWQSWVPDPPGDTDTVVVRSATKSVRKCDIISMLVNVYGSKELFVDEYRRLLADRLLSQFTYNTDKEIRYLELLKLRFGDSQLHYCEVMLKDVQDSKRINGHLHTDTNFDLEKQAFPVMGMILSAQFWPPFKEETLELPDYVKQHLTTYTKAFEMLKGNRTLNWKPHLGSVNIDIELKDRTVNLTVSPIHAAIIIHFQEQSEWTIEELSLKLVVPATVLRRRIAFWQSQGLVREASTDRFVLAEESMSRSKVAPHMDLMCEDEEAESAMASAHDQREEELQVFWSYIVGMLTNLESMPLERIHQMLKMFASQGPTSVECSLQELRHFLDRKARDHKLLFTGGFYRLPKT